MRWWALAVALACAWWAIPLVLLGRYSPPFLDWIEAAQNTTAVTSQSAILRGVEHWESYLGPGVWPAGWILVKAPAAVIATAIVAAAGLAGLAYRSLPHRLFLLSTLLLGLAILSLGHPADVTGPFAAQAQSLLDGPLVAFRNIHKFDPLVRLPVAVGVGALLSMTTAPWWGRIKIGSTAIQLPARLLVTVIVAAVALVALTPAFGDRLVPQARSATIPSWWSDAGSWLDTHSHGARTLVVPGAATPSYFWGETVDDALQPETDAPWIVRSSIPLAQAGTIRLLDLIDARLATGQPDDSLAPLLARSGIGFVLVRNDLNTTASLATPYNIVRSTLLSSPGFSRAAGFGPMLGGSSNPSLLIDGGAGTNRPAIEVFQVAGYTQPASVLPTAGAVLANGSSDNLAQLVDRGLGSGTPVLFGADAAALPAAERGTAVTVTTDGIRRQQASFGNTDSSSATMTATAHYQGSRAAYDYLPSPTPALSTMTYSGIRDVTASSSGADVYAAFNRSPANGPYAALDGDPTTAWHSASLTGAVGQWLQVDFTRPVTVPAVGVRFLAEHGDFPTQVSVTTASGTRIDGVRPNSTNQQLALPPGPASSLRITARAMQSKTYGSSISIVELSIPGVRGTRALNVPVAPLPPAAGPVAPAVVAFDAAPGYRSGCLQVSGQPSCVDELIGAGEEDGALARQFTTPAARTYQPEGAFLLRSSPLLDAQLDGAQAIQASASSRVSTDPRVRPGAAVDDDPLTTWTAAPGDSQPRLQLDLGAPRTVSGLSLSTAASVAVSVPQVVTVHAGAFHWHGTVPDDGVIRFGQVVHTASLTLQVDQASLRESESTLTGRTRLLPVGISMLRVIGAPPPKPATGLVQLSCSAGLMLNVDGAAIPLQFDADAADVLSGKALTARPCDRRPVTLAAGQHTVTLTGPAGALPRSLTFTDRTDLARSLPVPATMTTRTWNATHRSLTVNATAAGVLVVHENLNPGWTARLNGVSLKPIQVDGWQQGFLLPAGAHGTVVLDYGPQRLFDVGLLIGLGAVLVLLGLALRAPRNESGSPVPPGSLAWSAQVGLILMFGLQTAGIAGLAATVVLLAAVRLLWSDGRKVPVWIPASAFLIAGIDIASAPSIYRFTEANSSFAQLLTISAVVLAAATGLPRRIRRPRP
jgi:arabinofuranan 3-O-arabinosyltransferase